MNTNKIVITGGPGTGKSSLINELASRGFLCFEEIARQITLKAREDGIAQLFLTKPLLFSEKLIEGRIKQHQDAEATTEANVFLDRGLPDVLAYMNFIGDGYPKNFEEACSKYKYDHVFVLAPWQDIYKSDGERYENFEDAVNIHHNLLETYKEFGYNLIDVPFDSLNNRANFILKALKL